jgi:hypothetical protein
VRLLDWVGFQDEFERAWLKSKIMMNLAFQLGQYSALAGGLIPRAIRKGEPEKRQKLEELLARYLPLTAVAEAFTPDRFSPELPTLPLSVSMPWVHGLPPDLADAIGYRELVEALMGRCARAVEEMGAVLKGYLSN